MTPTPTLQQLQQGNYILDACGRQTPPPDTSWFDLPAHVMYTRFLAGDGNSAGNEDIGGVMHKGAVPFYLRALTGVSLPRVSQGIYWRLRYPSGRFFQSEMAGHAMAFGIGSDRQAFNPEVEWRPGLKMFVDLDSIIAGPPPSPGYSVAMQFEGVFRFAFAGPGAVSHPIDLTDPPRYFVGENQNILAPETRFAPGCNTDTPAGYQDEEFAYVTPVSNLQTSGAPVSNVGLQIEADSDFIIRQIWQFFPIGATNQGTGKVVVRMRRGDGYSLSNNFLPAAQIQGPVFPQLRIKARDMFYYDAHVVDGGGSPGSVLSFGLYLYGVKRRKTL